MSIWLVTTTRHYETRTLVEADTKHAAIASAIKGTGSVYGLSNYASDPVSTAVRLVEEEA